METKYLLLLALLSSALFVHYRGRVRHHFSRQLTDHSTFMAPFNALIYLFSRVPSTPFQRLEEFPQMTLFTDNWQTIRDEGLALMEAGKVAVAAKHNDIAFHSFFRNGWKRFYLKWYDRPLPSAERLCPKTVALLTQVPNVHGAMFTLLPPGGRLGQHRDPFAGSLRYHLGLRTPNSDACWIKVDGIPYSWRDGEAVMFDETFIHEAKNDTDTPRLIFFCDVERPMRGPIATAINRFIIRHIVKITQTQNEEGEKVGIINRIFAPFYYFKQSAKRFKQWNRKIYYATKYALGALLLAAIFVW